MWLAVSYLAVRYTNGTTAHRYQSKNGIAQRGLSHAIATNHRMYPGIQCQVDSLQRVRCSIVDMQIANAQQRRTCAPRPALLPGHRRSISGPDHAAPRDRVPAPEGRFLFLPVCLL